MLSSCYYLIDFKNRAIILLGVRSFRGPAHPPACGVSHYHDPTPASILMVQSLGIELDEIYFPYFLRLIRSSAALPT